MCNAYFSLTIKENYKGSKSETIGEIVKSQIKEEYVIENIVMGQTISLKHDDVTNQPRFALWDL